MQIFLKSATLLYILVIGQAVAFSLSMMFEEHFLSSLAFFSTFRHLMPLCFSFSPPFPSDCLTMLFYLFFFSNSSYYLLLLLSSSFSQLLPLRSFLILILTFYLSTFDSRFSRYDYQKVRNGPSPSYRSLIAALPLQVRT